jgi:peptidoglycan hydrolase-like protein with peptidoglycan-binding domain
MRDHEVDGHFGKITKNAVIAFQRMNKLTADGIVGDGTKAKLKEILSS